MEWIIALVVFFIGALILQGLRRIPADPPHKAVVTWFGKRTGEVKDEGWKFFFLYPFVTGAVLVDMTKKNQDLSPENVRTSDDMAEINIKVSVTWKPDEKRLIEYLNSGGEAGVNNILSDMVKTSVRELAANPEEHPFTWEEAVKMRDVFIAKIVAVIIGAEENPEQLKSIAADLRRGNGDIRISTLGIILSRLNITSIKPTGKLAETAEMVASERRQRDAEIVELDHVAERTKELAEKLVNLGSTPQQALERALEVVQTERKKISKDVKEIKFSPEVITAILDSLRGGRS